MQAFTRALLSDATPEGLSGPAQASRFAVYRNNVHVGLIRALAARFPVTEAVLGEAFFRPLARSFLRQSPPRGPVLAEWGDDFPAFAAGFPGVEALPWLQDLARLEAAWTDSYHAADAAPLTLADLGQCDLGAPLCPHPAARLVASLWPIGTIWSAHRGGPPAPNPKGAEAVLLCRPGLEVALHLVPPGDLAFLTALFQRQPPAEAALALPDPEQDFGRALAGLTALGAFAGEPR